MNIRQLNPEEVTNICPHCGGRGTFLLSEGRRGTWRWPKGHYFTTWLDDNWIANVLRRAAAIPDERTQPRSAASIAQLQTFLKKVIDEHARKDPPLYQHCHMIAAANDEGFNKHLNYLLGAFWEGLFCVILSNISSEARAFLTQKHKFSGAAAFGRWEQQQNRILRDLHIPDVLVAGNGWIAFSEVKHKNPFLYKDKEGEDVSCYGLTTSDFKDDLKIANRKPHVPVLYVVHDHDMAGGKWSLTNDPAHWLAEDLLVLEEEAKDTFASPSYDTERETTPFPMKAFRSLGEVFSDLERGKLHRRKRKG